MIAIINFLNRINLSKLRVRAEVSGVTVIIILLLDLHRFGAWYTGNACHFKAYGLPMLFTAVMPLAVYSAAWLVQKIISKGWFMLLYLFRIYILILPLGMINSITIKSVFKDPVWYDPSIFRPADSAFVAGIALLLLLPAVYTAVFVIPLWISGRIYYYAMDIPVLKRIMEFLGG